MQNDATWESRPAAAVNERSRLREATLRPLRLATRVGSLASACWAVRREPVGDDDRERAERLGALARRLCERHDVAISVIGGEPRAGSVIVANHLSYADALVLPRLAPAACVAKRELARWPLIGEASRRLGVVFVDRGSPISGAVALRRCARLLADGVSVIVFPEGTTTTGERLLPFKRGIFGVALRLGVPIVPVALRYDDPALSWVGEQSFLAHYARTIGTQPRTALQVWFGPSLRPCAADTPEALAGWAQTWIARRLGLPLMEDENEEREVA